MLGVELVRDRKTKEPANTEAADVMEKMKERGLLIGKGGLFGNTLRIKPPMCLNKDDADFLVAMLDEVLSEVEAANEEVINHGVHGWTGVRITGEDSRFDQRSFCNLHVSVYPVTAGE